MKKINYHNAAFQGMKIKHYRKKQKMTQAQLSDGIISVSYLSKIEKGTCQPSNEILKKLQEKLGISSYTSSERIAEKCKLWFMQLLSGDMIRATDYFHTYIDNNDEVFMGPYFNLIELHKISFYVQKNELDMVSKQIDSLSKNIDSYNQVEKYYWLKFLGDYAYKRMYFSEALNLYLDAETLIGSSSLITKEEENDLYYVVSLAASKVGNVHLSLTYTQKALNYYKNIYAFKRMSECHILLGIGYRRIGDLGKSEENYEAALKLAHIQNDSYLEALCYQNLGKLSEDINNHASALHYYHRSYQLSNQTINKLVPISSLMKLYYKLRDIDNTKKWLDKGLNLSTCISSEKSVYVLEFQAYHYLLHEYNQEFEASVAKTALPFLEKQQLNREFFEFSILLASFYFAQHKYKLSSVYYQKALQVSHKINSLI
ncbi:helix-turn-helix domain-containing protein [Paraliobacillus ryukyuensis]|uniref:helix-turn-helix domain-containing protein n=1 Tax=Paraliobacillus ryukyuensis TaxID=200904 RepID=UPI0009A87C43|nr:helix-turn-helix domain-containing protein [Paraliobacillus ryukyuensis]